MITPKWFLALAIVLALLLCGSVVAGPKRPAWGDPDIFEGVKPKVVQPRRLNSEDSSTQIVIDVAIYHRVVRTRHEHAQESDNALGNSPGAGRRDRVRR